MATHTEKRGSSPIINVKKFRNVTINGHVVPQGDLPPNPRHPDPDIPVEQRRDRFLNELASALSEVVPAQKGEDEEEASDVEV